ncbi:MAG: hypothetical protein KKF46_04080 [Nanoarchaeota archaeon]|nr:hypothetical protein [Nanoarchaeota archaeon]MBU1321513.1 hypothetical protein [Nanoarchaeota archaeon]MBU1597130.1 hypothetical protein [Nanoarchaeota archaeon]MBU2441536.1 hypothetical protein [Nanoarchaeota archaeon]
MLVVGFNYKQGLVDKEVEKMLAEQKKKTAAKRKASKSKYKPKNFYAKIK